MLVGVGQASGGLPEDVDGVLQRQVAVDGQPTLDDVGDRLAVDVLHGDVLEPPFVGDVVDVHDGRVIQLGGQARLVEEHGHHARVLGVTRLQDLEDHLLLEPAHRLLARDVELGHPARGQVAEHGVTPDLPADQLDGIRHRARILSNKTAPGV